MGEEDEGKLRAGKRERAGLGASNHESKRALPDVTLQVEKKRPPATGGHTLQRKDRDPLEVELLFESRNFVGAGTVARKAAHLSPRPVSGGILNASEGSLKGWGPSLLAPTLGLNQNVFGAIRYN